MFAPVSMRKVLEDGLRVEAEKAEWVTIGSSSTLLVISSSVVFVLESSVFSEIDVRAS